MCPKAHSSTIFRLQETLRTPHRGGLIYSEDATRNAGHWDTARTVLRENICMLIPGNRRQAEHAGPGTGRAPGRGSVSQSGPGARASGAREVRKPLQACGPALSEPRCGRQAGGSDPFPTHWAKRRNRGGLGWSLGLDGPAQVGSCQALWEVDAGRATQSRGLHARPRVHSCALLRARPWPSQERDPAQCPDCSPCETLGVLMVTQWAGRGGYSGRRVQEPGWLGA